MTLGSGKHFQLIFSLGLTLLLLAASVQGSTIYSWKDENGVWSYTDDPAQAPKGSRVSVMIDAPGSSGPSEALPSDSNAPQSSVSPDHVLTEGRFATQLAAELGLGEGLTQERAAARLSRAGIAPRYDRWLMNNALTPEVAERLRRLSVAAAERGRITLAPDQALLAFDSASALTGYTEPVAPDASEDRSDAPAPLPPPLITVAPPPPDYYDYYTWYPVPDPYWFGAVWVTGFFVLNWDHFHYRHPWGYYPRTVGPGHRFVGGGFPPNRVIREAGPPFRQPVRTVSSVSRQTLSRFRHFSVSRTSPGSPRVVASAGHRSFSGGHHGGAPSFHRR